MIDTGNTTEHTEQTDTDYSRQFDIENLIEILQLEWTQNIPSLGPRHEYRRELHQSIAMIQLLTLYSCPCDWIVTGEGDPYCHTCGYFVLKINEFNEIRKNQ